MLATTRAAIEVVRFAVASLPPESIKGWPYEALHKVADHVAALPDATVDDEELAVTLKSFATECGKFEQRRRVMTASIEGNTI